MKKKTGIVICAVGVLLCLVGVVMIAYSMGVKNAVRDTLALTVQESSQEASGKEVASAGSSKEDSGEEGTLQESEAEELKSEEAKTGESAAAESKEESKKEESKKEDSKKEDSKKEESKKEDSKKEDSKKEESKKEESKDGDSKQEETKTGGKGLAVPSVSGKLSVDGSKLVDQNGNPVQLRGISTHGLSWFPTYVDQNTFRQFREEWNVNVMRLAMYTYESGGYCTDGNKEDLKNIIYRGVQYATDLDMYVIIDWHVLQDLNPNTYKDEAKKFFDEMSKKYKDNNNVIYEICNEPNGGTSWSDIKSYAEDVIGVIRSNDEDAVILVGTPNWSQRVDEAAADPLTDYDNIMYTLHFYAATHKDDLRNTMVNAINAGLPVFVSEYGICDASGNGGLDKDSAKKWVDTMDQYGVSYVCWALSNKAESAALIKSSCSKTSQFSTDDLSEHGKWLYEMLTGKDAGGSQTGGGAGSGGGTDTASGNGDAEEFESGGLKGALSLKSSWDAGGQKNYQYDLVLTNPGNQATSSWAIDIHFSDNITLDSCWGGVCTVNGNTLHIISVDYNGNIPAGGTLKDIGFVIIGPSGLKVTK